MKISATIVIYNENKEVLKKVIQCFLDIDLKKELIVVDNSPKDDLKSICESFACKYIKNEKNVGFGKAHNIGFENLSSVSKFHLVLNPDVEFNGNDIKDMILWMDKNKDVALAVPKVYYPDGSFQHTIRDVPTPYTLIKRKLGIKDDEWDENSLNCITEIPFAHGCFFLFRSDVYKKIGGFDERFFMYMDDLDIFIRAKKYGKTVINPNYKIYHTHRKGSSKSFKHIFWHIVSAIKYFWKYR